MRVCLAVTMALSTMLATPDGRAATDNAQAMQWYRCNTHTHTNARPGSDANESPSHVARWYRTHGYHCIVITDHEFLTDVAPLNQDHAASGDFLVLRGQEITQTVADASLPTGIRHLHVNGIDIDKAIMPLGYPERPRDVAPSGVYQRNLSEIRAAGGIPQVNHPNLNWSVRLEDLLPLDGPYLLEIWNAYPMSNNLGGVGDSGQAPSTEALWDGLLSRGRIVWGVASDDAHEYHQFENREAPTPGKAWIMLQAASLTLPAVRSALLEGRFYASTGIRLERYAADSQGISIDLTPTPDWSPALRGSARFTTQFIGAGGQVLATEIGPSPTYKFRGAEPYVRASIVDSDGRRAWTQPAFRDGRGRQR